MISKSLKKSIFDVIERHEILRTIFEEDESGEVWQKIVPTEDLGLEIDYRDLSDAADKDAAIDAYLKEDAKIPFDLEKGPLVRVGLLQLAENQYEFYYNMHHIISDGWSLLIMSRDIMAYYNGYKNATQPELPELRIQYKDFASWQLSQWDSHESNSAKAFWGEKLAGEIPVLDLPAEKVRPIVKTYNGNSLQAYIDRDTTALLKEITKASGGSLYMGVITALNVLLYKYTAEKDIIIGSPVTGRDHFEFEDQIGFYLNILPLRNQVNPEENFKTFLGRIIKDTLEAYKHQSYPFDRLIEDLGVKYDMSRSPLFDISVTYNNIAKVVGEITEEELQSVAVLGESKCKNDLEFHFQEMDGCLSFGINYNIDVYEEDMMINFMKHFKNLLSNLVTQKETAIAEVEYLSETELNKILVAFNDTFTPSETGKTVLDLFATQVAKTPERTAVVFEDKSLTFQELDIASNKVANFLREEYNLKAEDVVGIQLDRNQWMIVAILGALKTGAAYVPINPLMPTARKEHIQQDTDIKVLITETNYIFDLSYFAGDVFAIDVEFDTLENEAPINSEISSEDLAYVIYTSGSTGMPKGVMVEHGSFMASMVTRNAYYEDMEATLAITPFSFDASIGILWNALTTGVTYHVIAEDSLKNPAFVVKYLVDNKVTCLCNPPSFYSLILKEAGFEEAPLKRVIMGGESIPAVIVKRHFELHPDCRVFNEYGPSENTIWSSVAEVKEDFSRNLIGKPIANNQIYILDQEQQLVPIRAKGEIYIGGDNLARGYLNRSELTAEKFIPNPFKKTARLYKTGDFARWTEEGEIEFIGREDNQIKVRGFRVELGEIESQIQGKDDISEVAVIAKKDAVYQNELMAYIVSEQEQNLKELKEFLIEKLPEYMIPSAFIQVEKLPLNINGKIDKTALLQQEGKTLATGVDYVAPETAKEILIAKVVAETLGLERVGVEDDFFFIGGNSLKLIELISKLKQNGYKINIAEIIKNPKVKDMADLLEEMDMVENVN